MLFFKAAMVRRILIANKQQHTIDRDHLQEEMDNEQTKGPSATLYDAGGK